MNKYAAVVLLMTFLIVLVGGMVIYFDNGNIEPVKEGDIIYISTPLGCLPTDKYTEEQWEAKERLLGDLNEERCD